MIEIPNRFNVAAYLIDRNVSEGRGNKVAIECGEQRISYATLLENVNRTGNTLRGLGVCLEERVLILLPDIPEFLYALFAVIKIGAVAVPTNTLLRPHEYEYILEDTRARIAIVSDGLLPQIEQVPRERRRYLEKIVVVGKTSAEYVTFEELLAEASAELDAEPTCKHDAAFWLYSSGARVLRKRVYTCITTWWSAVSTTRREFWA